MNQRPRSKQLLFTPSRLLCFLVMLLTPVGAFAQQWTTNGNNINNTNSGNVGIGTTTPGTVLAVQKSQNASTSVTVDNPYTTSGNTAFSSFGLMQNGVLRLHIASVNDGHSFLTPGTAQFWNFANAPTVFATNSIERMRISATGSVGIGTTSPIAILHVANATGPGNMLVAGSSLGVLAVQDTAAPANAKFYQWRSEGGLFRMSLVNDALTGMVQYNLLVATTSGNIGIGTALPNKSSVSRALTVNGSTDAIYELAIGDVRKATMYHNGAVLSITNNVNDALTLGTNNGEKVRIDSAGNMGIGTTSPAYKLDVNGTINATALRVNGSTVTSSQWTTTGTTINYSTGNVGIGQANPTEKLDVIGNIKVSGTINAKYQDMAEWVDSSQDLTTGTVVVLDASKSNQVIASTQPYDSRVAGVISLKPGLTLGEEAEGRVLVATTGRVRVKADASKAPIRIGDLLVTSDRSGFAMKSIPVTVGGIQIHRPGTLIGKALEPLDKGSGEILVLLSLQ